MELLPDYSFPLNHDWFWKDLLGFLCSFFCYTACLRWALTSSAMRCDYFLLLCLTAKIAVSWKSTHMLEFGLSFHQSYGEKLHGSHHSFCILLARQGQRRFCPSTFNKMVSVILLIKFCQITLNWKKNHSEIALNFHSHAMWKAHSDIFWNQLEQRKPKFSNTSPTKMRIYSLACRRFLPQWFLPEILLICFLN